MKKTKIFGISAIALLLIVGILTPVATVSAARNFENPFLQGCVLLDVDDLIDIACQGGKITFYMAVFYENGVEYVKGFYILNGQIVNFAVKLNNEYYKFKHWKGHCEFYFNQIDSVNEKDTVNLIFDQMVIR